MGGKREALPAHGCLGFFRVICANSWPAFFPSISFSPFAANSGCRKSGPYIVSRICKDRLDTLYWTYSLPLVCREHALTGLRLPTVLLFGFEYKVDDRILSGAADRHMCGTTCVGLRSGQMDH